MSKQLISKSTFIRGTQCTKALFLNKFYPSLKDPLDDKRLAVFSRGHQVGDTARGLFPGGIDAFPGSHKKITEWVKRTKELMEDGVRVIYEAAFIHEEVMAAVDILVKDGDGWKAYEVKSSARISAVYLEDAALQYYVLAGTGLMLHEFSLVHINTDYILEDKLNLHSLFTIVPVMEEVSRKRDMIHQQVAVFKDILKSKSVPDIEIGEHCHYPYPCDFISHCRKHLPSRGLIFELSGKSMSVLYQWFHAGKILISELGPEELDTRDLQIQAACSVSGKTHIEKEMIESFLKKLSYPLVFLDFETFMPAIPIYKGTHPYEQIPFQFSAHILDEPSGTLTHFDHVSPPGADPRADFTRALVRILEGSGTILAYNATFERMIMKQCASSFPEFAEKLNTHMARVEDLMEPFKKKWFYHPRMRGSASIKQVLPAIVPELSYDKLKINNGAAAMSAYESLSSVNDLFGIQETIDNLKEYCKLDTLAMVKLHEALISATQ